MKTRNEYLSDLEFTLEEFSIITKDDIKKRYRKLIKKYNVNHKRNNSDEDKYRVILGAYEALNTNKYLDDPVIAVIEEPIDIENAAEAYNRVLFDFLERAAFEIDLKKSDNKVVIIDNRIINFDVSNLTKLKYITFNKTKLLKLVRK